MFFFKDYLLVELYISLDAIRPKFFLWNTNTNNTDCVCVCVCVWGGEGGIWSIKKGKGVEYDAEADVLKRRWRLDLEITLWKYKVVIISCRMQPTSANISNQHLVHPAADDDFFICQNAHLDNCLSCQANVWWILQLMITLLNYFTLCKIVSGSWRKIFFCCHNFMKKSHSKLSKNEPENIPYIEVTWYVCKGI